MNNGEKNDKIKKILFNKNRKVGISSQNIMKKDEKIYKRKKKLTFLSAVPVSRCEETTADYKEQKERKKSSWDSLVNSTNLFISLEVQIKMNDKSKGKKLRGASNPQLKKEAKTNHDSRILPRRHKQRLTPENRTYM